MSPKAKRQSKSSKGESLGAGPVTVKELIVLDSIVVWCCQWLSSSNTQSHTSRTNLSLVQEIQRMCKPGLWMSTSWLRWSMLGIAWWRHLAHAEKVRCFNLKLHWLLPMSFTSSNFKFHLNWLRSDEFTGIQKECPLPPQKGGVYHPTDLKLIKVSNEAGRTYTAGANAAWVSPFWTPCSIPVIRSAVKLLMNSKWREPKILEMEVMVNSMSDPNNQQHRLGSMLKRLSPEEDHISYVLATWRDISIGENVEERGGMPIDLRSLSDQSVSVSIHHISDSYLSLSQLKF